MSFTMKIGIDDTTRCNVIGSLFIAMVVVKPDFFRRFSYLPIKDSKLLSRKQRDMIVQRTSAYLDYLHIHKIEPKTIDKENLNDLEVKGMIECLNSYKEFWKHKIYIDNIYLKKEAFLNRFNKFIPHNLKNIDLRTDKWIIINRCDEKYKVCSLASIYAKHYSDLEYDDLRRVYPDIGSGVPNDNKTRKFILNNPDCIHIRKSWKTYKNIIKSEVQ